MRDPKPHDILYEQISSRLWLLATTHLKNATQENKFPTLKPQKDNCECTSSKTPCQHSQNLLSPWWKFFIANVNKPCLNFMENLLPSSTFPETASALRMRRKDAWEGQRQSGDLKLEPLICHRCQEMRKIRQTCCHACMKLEESTVAGMARRAIGYYLYD